MNRQRVARFSRWVETRTLPVTSNQEQLPMKKQIVKKQSNRRGQGMTEYIIIVSLIAIASIGVTTLFGNNVRSLMGMAADALAGGDNIANRAAHSSDAVEKKTMKTYAQNNGANY